MSAPGSIFDDHKRPIPLSKLLGRGGEGTVYEILGEPTRAAKIYRSDKATARREKIFAMAQAQFYKSTSNVAYPICPLFHANGTFAGFTMEKVGGRKPVHELYSPSSRRNIFAKADFRFLVRAALNISNSIAAVHSIDCVIGDINHSGILISQEATASLIDADSFQFRAGKELHRCTVGVPDFTPPELQGARLDQIERSKNHDIFGLAVIIFNLLFMGRHPFVGGFLGGGDMPMERAIAEYRFVYSSDRSRTKMEPPPYVPTLADLPPSLARAFETSFGPSSAKGNRPSAIDWCQVLQKAEAEIVRCRSSPAHHYFNAATSCPWCRMERGFPGFIAFSSPMIFNNAPTSDLSQLISAIRAVPDPGMGQPLVACMPATSPVAAQAEPTNEGAARFFTATTGALISIPLLTSQTIPPVFAICLFAVCAFTALRASSSVAPSSKKSDMFRSEFQKYDEKYRTFIDNRKFSETKALAENEILQLGSLVSEQARLIAELSNKIRDAQMRRFLENHRLVHVKIKGLGASKKATLRSYGIESAADISKARIEAISGFGPTASKLLVGWRNTLERKFVFNPSQPINPNDVAGVKAQISQRRSEIEKNIQARLAELLTISSQLRSARSTIIGQATEIWKDLRQAEADEKAVRPIGKLYQRRKLFALSSAIVLILSLSLNMKEQSTPFVAQPATVFPPPVTSVSPPSSPQLSTAKIAPVSVPKPSTSSGIPAITPSAAPPLPPPIEISRIPMPPEAASNSTHTVQEPPSAQTLTKKLAELGYLPTSQGSSTAQIKQAVRDFKIANHLVANDEVDATTAQTINSTSARPAKESFLGGWSADETCSQGVQIEINSAQARTEGGSCKFNRFTVNRVGWKIQATCQVGAETWPANITLTLVGRQLSWVSERGRQDYYRCR